ncbi:MAG: ATP-binding cassette domain-containing protein [Candidatus Hodarchaeota archaeon]
MSNFLIRFDRVSKIYKNRFSGVEIVGLKEVSFILNSGDIIHVFGRNGSGKSTLLRIAARLLKISSGTVEWNLIGQPELNPRIGYCPDNPVLYSNVSLINFLQFIGKLTNLKKSKRKIINWLSAFSLTDFAQEPIKSLSKGMVHKVALIAALINQPSLVILDEPFSSLDEDSQKVLIEIITRMSSENTGFLIADPAGLVESISTMKMKL